MAAAVTVGLVISLNGDVTARAEVIGAFESECVTMEDKEQKKIGLSVVEKVHCTVHSALEQAIKWGYITTNADDGATFPRYKKKVRDI